MTDERQIYFMTQALKQATKAGACDEVPVGAVIVLNDKIIARGYNKRHNGKNALLHAEIVAIDRACKKLRRWQLDDCDLYVTLEPCPMCAGACINSRINNLYFGAYDPKGGCCGSLMTLTTDKRFNHTCATQGGILQQQCGKLLSDYFKAKRKVKQLVDDTDNLD